MARARTALVAGITLLALLVVGPARAAAPPPIAQPSAAGSGTVCVINEAHCSPLVPGGSAVAPLSARVVVTIGGALGVTTLVLLVRGRRRATRLAPGVRFPILRPPRGSFRIA